MPTHSIWNLIGLAAACLTSTSFIPQLIYNLRQPGAGRLSYGTLTTFVGGVVLWGVYGFHLRDWIIVGANAFTLTTLIALVALQGWQDLRLARGK